MSAWKGFKIIPLSRRAFLDRGLKTVAGLTLAGSVGEAIAQMGPSVSPAPLPQDPVSTPPNITEDDPSTFVFSRFKFLTEHRVNDEWDVLPEGDENFLRYLGQATNTKLSTKTWTERVVRVDDFEKMYTLPFLFMTSEGEFHLSEAERAALAEFFRRGGFLYGDDCVTQPNGDFFYRSFLREVAQVMPGLSMQPVPSHHEIYHCFYDFDGHSPFCQGTRHPDMGLFYENRMVAILTSGDVHCGWWGYVFQAQQETCFKFGVNVIVYALTH